MPADPAASSSRLESTEDQAVAFGGTEGSDDAGEEHQHGDADGGSRCSDRDDSDQGDAPDSDWGDTPEDLPEHRPYVLFWDGPFSNWHKSAFSSGGLEFSCVEQYMMYSKALLFHDADAAAEVMRKASPKQMKALGRQVRGFKQQTWLRQADAIVEAGCYAKFSQNEGLRRKLLEETGDRIIAEASPSDQVWGIGLRERDARAQDRRRWRGQNRLGEALMRVRARAARAMEPLSVEGGAARPLHLRAIPRCTVHWAWPAAAAVLSLLAVVSCAFSDGGRSSVASLLVAAPSFILPSRLPRPWPPALPREPAPHAPRQPVSVGAGVIPLRRRAVLKTVMKSSSAGRFGSPAHDGATPDPELLKKMEDNGLKPDVAEWLRNLTRWSREFEDGVLEPDVRAYNRMLMALIVVGDVNKSAEWFGKMEDAGVEPDVETYSHMAMAYAYQGDSAHTAEWVGRLVAAGGKPRMELCSMQLLTLANARDLEGTVAWFDRMVGIGVKPDVGACNMVIFTFARFGMIAKSVEWFERMVGAGLVPDVHTYNMMIMAYAEGEDVAGCKEWLKRMEDAGVEPDSDTRELMRKATEAANE